jgi:tetratricopeptide (TPR) repeat protein
MNTSSYQKGMEIYISKWMYLFIISLLIVVPIFSKADALSDYKKANDYYQKQDYDNAIKTYESLIKGGAVSPEVYYNLGNCYYKTGNVSLSLLNYERAHKLAPDDEDINFNLRIAGLKIVDKMDPVPEIFYKRWIKNIASLFSTNTWTKFLLGTVWLMFLFFAVYVVGSTAAGKKLGFISGIIMFGLAIVVFVIAQQSYAINFMNQQAIVTSQSAYVKSSPDEKGSDQFIIHEGTKVDVLDELGDWKKIRIANGSIGWLKQQEIETI